MGMKIGGKVVRCGPITEGRLTVEEFYGDWLVLKKGVVIAQAWDKRDARTISTLPKLIGAAKRVQARWENGDLAGAVNALVKAVAEAEARCTAKDELRNMARAADLFNAKRSSAKRKDIHPRGR